MASFGATLAGVGLLAVNLPRLGRGRIRMRPGPNGAALVHATQPAIGVARVAGPGRPAFPASSNYGAQFTREISVGNEWFDHIHILPRTTIDFGNIVTPVGFSYEIFNAFNSAVTFQSYLNNAGAGITLPNLVTPPAVLGAFNSFLDPATVRGSLVELEVVAGPDGPPSFDSFIHFVFDPGNEVDLFIQGTRIALLTPEAETPVIEMLRFATSVLSIANGKEQRISTRKKPRQSFEYEYIIEGLERQAVQALFFGYQAGSFGLPLWHERLILSAAVGIGANVASVASTANVDIRVGGYAVLFQSRTVFDVLQITAITSTTVTFASNTVNAYAAGDYLMPIRTVRSESKIGSSRFPVTVERFRPKFESTENDVGTPSPSAAGFSSHNGRVLVDAPNILEGAEMTQEFDQKLTVIDNETGVVTQGSDWSRNKRSFSLGFAPTTRAGLYALRQLLYFLRGRQTAFWIPTAIADLTVAVDLSLGSTQMVITNIGYTKYIAALHPKATFRITFTDNTTLIRTILSSIETSSSIETLTLDATWPAGKTVAQISSVQFLELVRFDTDDFRIVHTGIGRAKLVAPVKVVFDL